MSRDRVLEHAKLDSRIALSMEKPPLPPITDVRYDIRHAFSRGKNRGVVICPADSNSLIDAE